MTLTKLLPQDLLNDIVPAGQDKPMVGASKYYGTNASGDFGFFPVSPSSVLQFANLAAFPVTGVANTLYIDSSTNQAYEWNGTGYDLLGDNEVQPYVNFAGFPATGIVGVTYIDLATDLSYVWDTTTNTYKAVANPILVATEWLYGSSHTDTFNYGSLPAISNGNYNGLTNMDEYKGTPLIVTAAMFPVPYTLPAGYAWNIDIIYSVQYTAINQNGPLLMRTDIGNSGNGAGSNSEQFLMTDIGNGQSQEIKQIPHGTSIFPPNWLSITNSFRVPTGTYPLNVGGSIVITGLFEYRFIPVKI